MPDVPSSASSPGGLRMRKKRETRRALHDAALRLALEHGIEHATVEEISSAANVSPRTFFNYFPNKEQAVLGDVVTIDAERATAVIQSAATVLEGLRKVALVIASDTTPEREQVLMRWQAMERYPTLLPHMHARFMEFEQVLAGALAKRTGGKPDDAYPQLGAAVAGTAMRISVRRWTRGHGGHPLEYHVNEVFGLLGQALPETGQQAGGEAI
ncbi:MAG: TetR family transcriptional regulator [Nocardiopsaceae bacterium]|nr:TetR family transcriptional regulator [Nocardiopsaceae bacterium]